MSFFSGAIKLCIRPLPPAPYTDVSMAMSAAQTRIHNKGQFVLQEKNHLSVAFYFLLSICFLFASFFCRILCVLCTDNDDTIAKQNHLCQPVGQCRCMCRCDNWWINNRNIYFNTQKIWCLHIYEVWLLEQRSVGGVGGVDNVDSDDDDDDDDDQRTSACHFFYEFKLTAGEIKKEISCVL